MKVFAWHYSVLDENFPANRTMNNSNERANFIWSVADLLRGPYRPNQYKDVMLPMTVLRRLDCVLEPTRQAVLARAITLEGSKIRNVEPILNKVSGQQFHNTCKFTFEKLKGDPNNIAANLTQYIKGFSSRARDIIEHFGFEEHIAKLDQHNRLYLLVSKFCEIDLHPDSVPNIEMGYIFEDLIRRFNEASNEEAGDHFTPREVIRLMVNLLFNPDNETLTKKGIVRTMYDPAAGTGGMLSVSEEYLRELNPEARLEVFGQDYNNQAYAICGSDMMIKGQSMDNIRFGNSFIEDHMAGRRFDYMLANPPFGVEWKPEADVIKREYEEQGYGGRFGAGLPRINDGSFLFLQHMISKMKQPKDGGSRIAIVFNRSPLYAGDALSGESSIREWILNHDLLEAIVSLPTNLFYNTGIPTYIWLLSNRKTTERQGKVQLIDASWASSPLRKSLGAKRNEITGRHIAEITRLHGEFTQNTNSRIFDNKDFYFNKITIDHPLRLDFRVSQARMAKFSGMKAFRDGAPIRNRSQRNHLSGDLATQQKNIVTALSAMDPSRTYFNRSEFEKDLTNAFRERGVEMPESVKKAIISALSESNPDADICIDERGHPEPDPDLRDYENVPCSQSIERYFKEELEPYYSDSWVDLSRTKLLVEIPFARYFVKQNRLRPLGAIMADIDIHLRLAKTLIDKG